MASVNIGDLFDGTRFPKGLALIPVFLYIPLGICLATVRIFIGFHAFLVSCLLPKMSIMRCFILRVMCGVLGIFVTHQDRSNRNRKAKVLVTNHITTLDHMAIELVMPHIMPSVWDLPPALNWLLGYVDLGVKQGRAVLIANAKRHLQESNVPILSYPEGASTNGRVGLLKFSVWPFSLGQGIQPVIMKVKRPYFVNLRPSVLGGRWWIDIFWFLFVPYTHFKLRILPVQDVGENESMEDFSKRVQSLMAKELGVTATNHTSLDKVEYAKRTLIGSQAQAPRRPVVVSRGDSAPQTASRSGGDSPLDRMSQQVKEVLPHVPLSVIKRDLGTTGDIDVTITNLLEGNVAYVPEEPAPVVSSPKPKPALTPQNQPPPSLNTAAKTFPKSSTDRQLSFEERKRALIESARRRYMVKHNML